MVTHCVGAARVGRIRQPNRRRPLVGVAGLRSIEAMTSTAKFLVLADAKRAVLFDCQQRLIGEVIEDDGFIVDRLIQAATACPVPHPGMLKAMVPPPSPMYPVRCFALPDTDT